MKGWGKAAGRGEPPAVPLPRIPVADLPSAVRPLRLQGAEAEKRAVAKRQLLAAIEGELASLQVGAGWARAVARDDVHLATPLLPGSRTSLSGAPHPALWPKRPFLSPS